MTESQKEKTLWAVHIVEPNDIIACPNKAIAEATVDVLNKIFKQLSSEQTKPHTVKLIEWPDSRDFWCICVEHPYAKGIWSKGAEEIGINVSWT